MQFERMLLYLLGIFMVSMLGVLWIMGTFLTVDKRDAAVMVNQTSTTSEVGIDFEMGAGAESHEVVPTLAQPVSGEQLMKEISMIEIPLYRASKEKKEVLPLESYIVGVVAAEMPSDFEMEALKAQAIAARTYMVHRIINQNFNDVPVGSWVNDTIQHQAYLDRAQLRERWGDQYDKNIKRIEEAVYETAGMVITYNGRPINATFFSTSNGYTENSEEYWSESFPYLRSVPSHWDEASPRYQETVRLPIKTFEEKLGVKVANSSKVNSWYSVLEKTTGQRIGKVKIGEKTMTGREVREKLGLNSSSFTWTINKDEVVITTYGYGHGVGMSQWGANGMAKEGKKVEEIIVYYYTDVKLHDYRDWLRKS